MQFVDTHTHIYLPEFDADRKEVVDRALDAGITKMVLPNVDLGTIGPMRRLASEYPENFSMAIGLHPTEVNQDWEKNLKVIYDELDAHSTEYIAIGEIGIDLYWDKTFRKEQMQVLEQQLKWAIERDLPVIIHCREGLNEVLDVMDSMNEVPVGVFHSFGGSIEDVRRSRNTGDFYFGINGIVTFKNSRLKDVLPE
ncbi:MAG: TatD family hydrolase, partial [Duncaniella sp.]|nr:TatD family hydrolase [Duncaniella sp.]